MSLFHKVDRDIKREGGGGDEGVREKSRGGEGEEEGWRWQRKRRVGLLSLLRPCVLRAEGGDVGGLDTL